jgi:tRNA dimethylallyltransferase
MFAGSVQSGCSNSPASSPTDNDVTQFPITQPVLVIVGPTAIGKTALSLELARVFNCEIVNLDSMQVYRYMDIGTAKATEEERSIVPHHLIDIVDPDQEYDAERFVSDACNAIKNIHSRKKIPLLTGGTGLYLRALNEGLFIGGKQYPEIRARLKTRLANEGSSILHQELFLYDRISADKIHINDTHRLIRALEIYYGSGIPWSEHLHLQAQEKSTPRFTKILQIGLTCDRKLLYERINKRCKTMLHNGLEQEVRGLMAAGYSQDLKSMMSIGYRHMVHYIKGVWQQDEMEELLARDTRRYAKRQFTWFHNTGNIKWFNVSEQDTIMSYISGWFGKSSKISDIQFHEPLSA